jgi:signal transduction histidine kinase
MGVGIWSMHFIGMLAFSLPSMMIGYQIGLLILSVLVAVAASAVALYTVSREHVSPKAYGVSTLFMGAAISGMHYIGIASMRLPAIYTWNLWRVVASIVIAVSASYVALLLAVRFRRNMSLRGFYSRGLGGVVMGFAISGMHYTAMSAMTLYPAIGNPHEQRNVLATEGLAVAVSGTTLLILLIALAGSVVDRAFARRSAFATKITGILESITDAFYSVDRNWNFTYVNSVARSALKEFFTDDPLRRNLWQAVPDILNTKFETEARKSMATGEPAHFEDFLKVTKQWLDIHMYPSREGLSVYFQDITARKTSEQALRDAIRARDEFLSVASHELKTPLTSLKLQSDLHMKYLKANDQKIYSPDKLKELFERESKQIDKLSRLVEDMLDISRISTGRLTMQIEEFDLCELVRDVVGRYTLHMEQAQCQVLFEGCEKLVGRWDKFRIEQVITNLLTNAARYGAGKPVHVQTSHVGTHAKLSVRDEGMGIAKENQTRIFERFERAVSSNQISGLGLGLYIARQIVEMHGGTLWVESELGQGSTFFVELSLKG